MVDALLGDAHDHTTPPISSAARHLLSVAHGLYHALTTGGIAADLDCEAKGRYEAGELALISANPYTLRVAYLQLLQAFREKPGAVEQAIARLHRYLEEIPFTLAADTEHEAA